MCVLVCVCVCGLFMMTDAETSPSLSRVSCSCPDLPSLVPGLILKARFAFKGCGQSGTSAELPPRSHTHTHRPGVRGQPVGDYQRCQRQKVAELLRLLGCRTCRSLTFEPFGQPRLLPKSTLNRIPVFKLGFCSQPAVNRRHQDKHDHLVKVLTRTLTFLCVPM